MKQIKARKPAVFERDLPDLPAELQCPDAAADLFADSEVVIAEQRLQDVDRRDLTVSTFQVEGSVLERVQLAGGRFGSVVLKDARLVGCDLANVLAHRINLVRVELIDCRLTGFRATTLDWRDVLVQNGNLGYSQLQRGLFRSCEFDGCNLQEADLQEADLTGSMVRKCNLARADLRGAKLQNTDLRGSDVEELLVGMEDLQGAVVDAEQAVKFARLLGLQIRY